MVLLLLFVDDDDVDTDGVVVPAADVVGVAADGACYVHVVGVCNVVGADVVVAGVSTVVVGVAAAGNAGAGGCESYIYIPFLGHY